MTKPIAYVTGYHDGYPVIQPTDGAAVLPTGMALYAHHALDVQPVAWMYTANGERYLTFTDQRPVEAYHTHFDKSTPLYERPPICKQDLHVDQWNCNIRDSVDRLLEQAGFAPDSSVRHQLAMMKLSKGDKK